MNTENFSISGKQGFANIKVPLAFFAFLLFLVILLAFFSLITSPEFTAGYGLAFFSGISMIVLPCTFPMVLVIVPLAVKHGYKKGLLAALVFGLGVTISMAIVGIFLGGLGQAFGMNQSVRIVFGIAGTLAYLLGLSELGLLNIRITGIDVGIGRRVQKHSIYIAAFFFGLALGDAGIGCPNPAFYVLIGYIVNSASMVQGLILGFLHGLGRATPLIFLVVLALLGMNAIGFLAKKREALNNFMSFTFLGIGAFFASLAVFGGWWGHSFIHEGWDNIIAGSMGTKIAEAGVEFAHAHPVAFGWPLAPWFILFSIGVPLIFYFGQKKKENAESHNARGLFFKFAFVFLLVILITIFNPIVTVEEHAHAAEEHAENLSLLMMNLGLIAFLAFIFIYPLSMMLRKKYYRVHRETV